MSDEAPVERPSIRTAFANFRGYDAPFLTKLRMSARNTWIKARTRKDCCGHEKEPGCCLVEPRERSG